MELVIATPLLLAMLLLVVQFGVWLHAVHTAQATAAHALATARQYGATPAQGQAEAQAFLGQTTGGALASEQITVTRDGPLVHAAIDGYTQPVLPLITLPIHVNVTGPLETWTTTP